MKKQTVIGLMSGTSLDGLDICAVDFRFSDNSWSFVILNSETVKYSTKLKSKFATTTDMSSFELLKFDIELGQLMGRLTKQFIVSNRLRPDFIASHGHTVFHQPENNLTRQIGSGQHISIETNLPVVYDFRSKDVALGGQGAPLVPIGDKKLFKEYDACINLGGIANISFDSQDGERLAFDICPFNMGLNFLANELDLEYDDSGLIAKRGNLDLNLLNKLDKLDFYKQEAPKSLGVEWFNSFCLPLLSNKNISVETRLHTFSHHIATQLAIVLKKIDGKNVLITGGGSYNDFVIQLLKEKTSKIIIKPTISIIDYKEALIFGFLGLLRINDEINVLKSVTGAIRNSSSGVVVFP